MDYSTWLLYWMTCFIVVLTPGPAILLAVSNSVAYGWRTTVFSSLGNGVGLFCISGLTMVGLGTVLKTSATLFMILKLVGAAYLVYLAVQQWRSEKSLLLGGDQATVGKSWSRRQFFLQGFGVATTNPKAILFFTALFPQFIQPEQALVPQFFALTATFTAFALCSHAFYVVLIRALKVWFSGPRRAMIFNRILAGLFMALGVTILRLKNTAN